MGRWKDEIMCLSSLKDVRDHYQSLTKTAGRSWNVFWRTLGNFDSWPMLYRGIFLSPPFTAKTHPFLIRYIESHQNVWFYVICFFLKSHIPIGLSFLQTACEIVVKSFLKGSASFNPAESGAFYDTELPGNIQRCPALPHCGWSTFLSTLFLVW